MYGVSVEQLSESEGRWTKISIPTALVETIRDRMEDEGYKSVSEFVRDACRHRLETLPQRPHEREVKHS